MAVTLDENDLRARLIDIVEADDRAPLVSAFVDHLARVEILEVWAREVARSLSRIDEYEEFGQVAAEAIINRLNEIDREQVDAISVVAAHLYYVCRRACTVHVDSPAVTVAQGMSGISRRYRESRKHRSDYYRDHGTEPTDAELVEYINQKVSARRKDAAKQGALVSEADINGQMLRSYSTDYTIDGSTEEPPIGQTDGGLDQQVLLTMTINQIGAIADEMFGTHGDPPLRAAIASWTMLVSSGTRPTAISLAEDLGVNRRRSGNLVHKIEAVLTEFRVRNGSG